MKKVNFEDQSALIDLYLQGVHGVSSSSSWVQMGHTLADPVAKICAQAGKLGIKKKKTAFSGVCLAGTFCSFMS